MTKRTPLFDLHVNAGAKIVDFAGWEMPLHYGSQLNEHHTVRNAAGMFDVSHMGVVDIKGEAGAAYLKFLLANNIDKITNGKALYTCMLNHDGGVIDDLIVYQLDKDLYRLVINAGRREVDMQWIRQQSQAYSLEIVERTDLAMLAIQGPQAKEKLAKVLPHSILEIKPFHFVMHGDMQIARTGYTGEDGFEIISPPAALQSLWEQLLQDGCLPCGLGARDTLRLEAGLNLYGADMNEAVTPLESNLSWTVALEPYDRQFIGREAIEKQKQTGIKHQLVGLILDGAGIMRNHQKVKLTSGELGEVTSGGYSPTLEKSIGLARLPLSSDEACFVEIRHKDIMAKIVKPPFVRNGKKVV